MSINQCQHTHMHLYAIELGCLTTLLQQHRPQHACFTQQSHYKLSRQKKIQMHTGCHALFGAILRPQGLDTARIWRRVDWWRKTLMLPLTPCAKTTPQTAHNKRSQLLMCSQMPTDHRSKTHHTRSDEVDYVCVRLEVVGQINTSLRVILRCICTHGDNNKNK